MLVQPGSTLRLRELLKLEAHLQSASGTWEGFFAPPRFRTTRYVPHQEYNIHGASPSAPWCFPPEQYPLFEPPPRTLAPRAHIATYGTTRNGHS